MLGLLPRAPANGLQEAVWSPCCGREKWMPALLEDPSSCFFCALASGAAKCLLYLEEKFSFEMTLCLGPLGILSVDPDHPHCLWSWVAAGIVVGPSPASGGASLCFPGQWLTNSFDLYRGDLSSLICLDFYHVAKPLILKKGIWSLSSEKWNRGHNSCLHLFLSAPLHTPITFLPRGCWALL